MFGIAGQSAYRSNKEAVRGLTKIAAKEWAQKFPEEYQKQVILNPMCRFSDPEADIAPVIAFLARPDSCYYSGQCLLLDGANSIAPYK